MSLQSASVAVVCATASVLRLHVLNFETKNVPTWVTLKTLTTRNAHARCSGDDVAIQQELRVHMRSTGFQHLAAACLRSPFCQPHLCR
jgi:hypothetical protein